MDTKTHPVIRPLMIEHQIAVGTYEIDFAGHVSNQVYFRWLEDMRLKLFDVYFPLQDFLSQGITPVLVSTTIDYKRSIRLFDKPTGTMWVSSLGNASLTIEAEFHVNGLLTTRAKHVGVFVELKSMRPVRLPVVCVEKFGESMRALTGDAAPA